MGLTLWQLWMLLGLLGSVTLVWVKSDHMPQLDWQSVPLVVMVVAIASVILGPLMCVLAYLDVTEGPDGEA